MKQKKEMKVMGTGRGAARVQERLLHQKLMLMGRPGNLWPWSGATPSAGDTTGLGYGAGIGPGAGAGSRIGSVSVAL